MDFFAQQSGEAYEQVTGATSVYDDARADIGRSERKDAPRSAGGSGLLRMPRRSVNRLVQWQARPYGCQVHRVPQLTGQKFHAKARNQPVQGLPRRTGGPGAEEESESGENVLPLP